jgi:hypothetical protein
MRVAISHPTYRPQRDFSRTSVSRVFLTVFKVWPLATETFNYYDLPGPDHANLPRIKESRRDRRDGD